MVSPRSGRSSSRPASRSGAASSPGCAPPPRSSPRSQWRPGKEWCMSKDGPKVIVLAGPNGAGKSTAAARVLRALGVGEFVNADVIAQGLSGFAPERVAMAAGRIMMQRLKELAAARASFAFETTLASRAFAPWLTDLKAGGYQMHLVFLWLPGAEVAMDRVAERVRR